MLEKIAENLGSQKGLMYCIIWKKILQKSFKKLKKKFYNYDWVAVSRHQKYKIVTIQ